MLPAVCADPSATGFLLASLPDTGGPILWVQDHTSRRENGSLYMSSLPAFRFNRPVLQVHVNMARDVLWDMEDGG